MVRQWALLLSTVACVLLVLQWALAGGSGCGDCTSSISIIDQDVTGCSRDCLDGSCINYYGVVHDCSGTGDECSGTYKDWTPVRQRVSTCFPTQGIGCKCHDGGTPTGEILHVRTDTCKPCKDLQ